ncbi:MAG: tellurium resistance protein [Rhodobacterales bacterium]|nr:MAG: tellurium resistance protein [Rhodobacterales bacterium]
MPTAARLVSAVLLAALAWVVSDMIRAVAPPDTQFGKFNFVNLGLGLLVGWMVIGSRVGHSYTDGISAGLTGVAALVFWGLFTQGANEMVRLAMDNRYGGPLEAVMAVFEIGVEFALYLWHMPIVVALVGGGVVIGGVAEFVGRRWS